MICLQNKRIVRLTFLLEIREWWFFGGFGGVSIFRDSVESCVVGQVGPFVRDLLRVVGQFYCLAEPAVYWPTDLYNNFSRLHHAPSPSTKTSSCVTNYPESMTKPMPFSSSNGDASNTWQYMLQEPFSVKPGSFSMFFISWMIRR